MKSFADVSQTVPWCDNPSCSKTPCSSWWLFQSQRLDSCMPTAAPPIKTGYLSGPCVCPVGEVWPGKYASDTFPWPIIESQPNRLVMHIILKAQHCVWTLLIPKPTGVPASTHAEWYCRVLSPQLTESNPSAFRYFSLLHKYVGSKCFSTIGSH